MANGSDHPGSNTVLVLGSNGKTGSRIVDRLRAAGKDVRLGSRSATPPFDWNDQTSWPAVLEGIGAVYVAYQPRDLVDLIVYLFTTVLDGRNTPLADGVQRALGRGPKKFSDYAERTAAAGAWDGQAPAV